MAPLPPPTITAADAAASASSTTSEVVSTAWAGSVPASSTAPPAPAHPAAAGESGPVDPRRFRALFQAGNFVYWMALYFYVPVLPVYAQSMGASLSVVGVMLSAYGVMQLLLRIPTGLASDALGRRKPFVLAGAALAALGALVFAVAPAPWLLVVARALSGVAACAWVAITVMYAGYYPAGQATRAIAAMGVTNGLGQVIATWSGGIAADHYGWTAPFLLSIVAGIVAMALMALCRESVRAAPAASAISASGPGSADAPSADGRGVTLRATPAPVSWRRLWQVGTSRRLLLISGLSAVNTYATFATVFGFVPVYAKELGATRSELGLLTAVSLIPYTLIQPFAARAVERFGFRVNVAFGLVLVGATAASTPLTHTFLTLTIVQVVNGIGRGVLNASLMSLAIVGVEQHERATAMGVYQAIYSIGMFLGPLIGGVIGEHLGLDTVFTTTGALTIAAGLVAWRTLSEAQTPLQTATQPA